MDYTAGEIKSLISTLARRKKISLGHRELKALHLTLRKTDKVLASSAEDYLYKLYQEVKDMRKNATLNRKQDYIDAFARQCGYKDFDDFRNASHQGNHPVLEACKGDWLSYVRCNSGNRHVLISPVNIEIEGSKVRMLLRGPARTFEGELKLTGDCIYTFLESDKEKHLHLVFKIGRIEEPRLLQGIFSGISSGSDPIAGRELLVKQPDGTFDSFDPQRIHLDELKKEYPQIAAYFDKRDKNIIKAGRSSTFTMDDLYEQ